MPPPRLQLSWLEYFGNFRDNQLNCLRLDAENDDVGGLDSCFVGECPVDAEPLHQQIETLLMGGGYVDIRDIDCRRIEQSADQSFTDLTCAKDREFLLS